MSAALPSLFVSHGSPMLALDPGSTGPFFERLGRTIDVRFGTPRGIVIVSPHTSARRPVLLPSATHHAVHDFSGFPEALYRLRYEPPGSPELGEQVSRLFDAGGIAHDRSVEEGLDHGIWSVLRFAWPAAEVPVLPVALAPYASPAEQWAVGAALAPLRREGVLVIGSGSLTHNLRLMVRTHPGEGADAQAVPEIEPSRAFRQWIADHTSAGDREALLDYRARAPHAALMHPSDEHWLPFYIAAGAGGLAGSRRLHDALTYGCLAMDAYAFGDGAAALHDALKAQPAGAGAH
jgi:4,5-DOPA dioxygenase extradiol